MKVCFEKSREGFFCDKEVNKRGTVVRYVLDRSEKSPMEGCNYEILPGKEVASKLKWISKVVFVTLPNRQNDEFRFMEELEATRKWQEGEDAKEKLKDEWHKEMQNFVDFFKEEKITMDKDVRDFFGISIRFSEGKTPSFYDELLARQTLSEIELTKRVIGLPADDKDVVISRMKFLKARKQEILAWTPIEEEFNKEVNQLKEELEKLPRKVEINFKDEEVIFKEDRDGNIIIVKYTHGSVDGGDTIERRGVIYSSSFNTSVMGVIEQEVQIQDPELKELALDLELFKTRMSISSRIDEINKERQKIKADKREACRLLWAEFLEGTPEHLRTECRATPWTDWLIY
jgi:hypothetical protein